MNIFICVFAFVLRTYKPNQKIIGIHCFHSQINLVELTVMIANFSEFSLLLVLSSRLESRRKFEMEDILSDVAIKSGEYPIKQMIIAESELAF